jgi:hypothetical protein
VLIDTITIATEKRITIIKSAIIGRRLNWKSTARTSEITERTSPNNITQRYLLYFPFRRSRDILSSALSSPNKYVIINVIIDITVIIEESEIVNDCDILAV